jgi:hypothetical protein
MVLRDTGLEAVDLDQTGLTVTVSKSVRALAINHLGIGRQDFTIRFDGNM